MATDNVRGCLRRACEEIEDVTENVPGAEPNEDRLAGIAEQLRYLVEGDPSDPEALARPDPDALDTIRNNLDEIVAEADGDTATRLDRACDEVLRAISVLEDRREKERAPRTEPE